MGFLDEIRSYFRNDEPTPTEQAAELNRQRREDQFGDLPNEIEEMPPEDVADTFARMQQDDRLAFVRNRSISKEKWDEMMSMIESNSKQQDFWGIDDSQTEIQDGVSVCICHEEEVQTWTETRGTQKTIGQTQGTSKTSKTEAGSKVSGSGGVGIPGVGSIDATGEVSTKKGRTQGQSQQEMAQATDTTSATKKFKSCQVKPTNSTVSRRGFLQVGNFHIGRQRNKTNSNNALIDNWETDVEQTPELEKPQEGIGALRAEKNEIKNQIEGLDEGIEAINNKIEDIERNLTNNRKFIEQNTRLMDENKDSIEKRKEILNERDRLQEKRERLQEKNEGFREKLRNTQEEKKQLQTKKSELQDRIEGHEEYEEAAETAESTESVSGESEDEAVGEESAEDTTQENDGTESVEESEDTALAEESEETVAVDGTTKEASTAEATEASKEETESTTTMDDETDSAKEEAEGDTVGDKTAKKAAEMTEPTADPAQATGSSSDRGSSAPHSDGVPPEIAEAGEEGDRIMEEIESQLIENGHGASTQNIEEKPEDSGSSV
ncbi:hypothetical protein [Halocatena marina]|uniref:Uncharacterized protein n=1 Tax=Halocatena marina TaxID=2934937 RepID=A0ABD5YZU7_9EURY|nr:hypothetical protein [Halocatena marina]